MRATAAIAFQSDFIVRRQGMPKLGDASNQRGNVQLRFAAIFTVYSRPLLFRSVPRSTAGLGVTAEIKQSVLHMGLRSKPILKTNNSH